MQALTKTIVSLINLHQEGPYWDFKREWHDDTVVFDCSFAEERLRVTGSVVSVDNYWKMLQISNIAIDFSEICEIIL